MARRKKSEDTDTGPTKPAPKEKKAPWPIHEERSMHAGNKVQLSAGIKHGSHAGLAGSTVRVRDWWDRCGAPEGKTWEACSGHAICDQYAKRLAANGLPKDNEVLLVDAGTRQQLVHISELYFPPKVEEKDEKPEVEDSEPTEPEGEGPEVVEPESDTSKPAEGWTTDPENEPEPEDGSPIDEDTTPAEDGATAE